jgi:hypothetical protein
VTGFGRATDFVADWRLVERDSILRPEPNFIFSNFAEALSFTNRLWAKSQTPFPKREDYVGGCTDRTGVVHCRPETGRNPLQANDASRVIPLSELDGRLARMGCIPSPLVGSSSTSSGRCARTRRSTDHQPCTTKAVFIARRQ